MKNFLLALLSIFSFTAMAQYYEFMVGEFGYEIISLEDRTVAVGYAEPGGSGVYVIPEKITYSDVEFSVIRIDFMAFSTWGIKSVTIPPSIELIEPAGFWNTSYERIETIIISDSPKVLDCTCISGTVNNTYTGQFGTTQCKNVYIGRDLKYDPFYDDDYNLPYEPFFGLNTLENFEIGEYVTDITHLERTDLSNLKGFTLHAATPPAITATTFSNLQYLTLEVKVPAEAVETYKSAKHWSNFIKITAIEENSVNLNVDYNDADATVYVNKQLYSGEMVFEKGVDIELSILPARGKEIHSVLVNGVELVDKLENNTLYLDNVEENLLVKLDFSMPPCMVRLIGGDGGCIALPVSSGSSLDLTFEPNEGWKINAIFVNDDEKTYDLNNNVLHIDNIVVDCYVSVVFEKEYNRVAGTSGNDVSIAILDRAIAIENPSNELVEIYNTSGCKLYQKSGSCTYRPQQSGIYIIKVGNRVYKVAI